MVVTLQKSTLPDVIDIDQGHFCRSRFTMDAGTFELKNRTRQSSFNGILDVILHAHATKKISTMQTILRYVGLSSQPDAEIVTVFEKFGLDIPTPIVSKLTILLNWLCVRNHLNYFFVIHLLTDLKELIESTSD